MFAEEFVFERQTYWYEQVAEYFALKSTEADATAFPLGFPFGFMGNVFQKQYKIKNKFFISAPIALKISGYIKNNIRLYIATLDGAVVAEVQLSRGNTNGTTIIIEPTTKKITVIDDEGNISNGYGLTDKTKQSFLYLPQGDYYIGANMDDEDTGKIEITIKRYLLD